MSTFFQKLFSRIVVFNCLGVVVAGIVIVVAALFAIDSYTHHGKEVIMPNLIGLSESNATSKLEAMGLRYEVTDTGYVQRAAAGSILEQSIAAGEHIKVGRIITLTINADGPRKIALPDIADNCSRREAEDRLRVLGFKLAKTEYIVGDPEWVYQVKVGGKVIMPGTRISVNSPITLVVGTGGQEEEYNGNDSLDYILNSLTPEEEGGEGVDHSGDGMSSTPHASTQPL